MSDSINPDHYKVGGIETFEVIKAKQSPDRVVGYCQGNQEKYLHRRGHKVDKDADREAYLIKVIEECDKQSWYTSKEKEVYQEELNEIRKKKEVFKRTGSPVIDAENDQDIDNGLYDEG